MDPATSHPRVVVTSAQRALLQRWARARTAPQRVVLRSAIVLLAADGMPIAAIARRLGTSRSTVRLWCRRFSAGGPPALLCDAPGRGRKPTVSAGALARVLAHGGARLSVRQLARRFGTSASAVHRALVVHRQLRNTDELE
jgi:AcrR family transcriptional regulator